MKEYNEILNQLLPFIENNEKFIEDELFNFFKKNEIFSYLQKRLISFKIKVDNNSIYFNDEFFFNGKTHFNTFLYYDMYRKNWTIFYGRIDENNKIKINTFFKRLVRILKIENIKKMV